HPPVMFCRIAVGHQGHHTLADTDSRIQRKTLHLQYDADGRKSQIMVGSHHLVDDHVIQIKKKSGDGRGNPHGKDFSHTLFGGSSRPRTESNHSTPSPLPGNGPRCGSDWTAHWTAP